MGDHVSIAEDPNVSSGTREPVRVLVVDDQDLFRRGLRNLLDGQTGITVVADARRGKEAVARAAELGPDVILMDINMPGMSGIEAASVILDQSPGIALLMLTVSEADHHVLDAVLAGATGYLLKDATLPEIVSAIRAAAAGQSPVSPRVAGSLLARVRRCGPREVKLAVEFGLSPRELDVLELLVNGCENGEIATRLHLSRSTIKHHVSSILEKLGVDNRIQAAVCAVRRGLTDEREEGAA